MNPTPGPVAGWGVFAFGICRPAARHHRLSAVTGIAVAFGFFLVGEMTRFELIRFLMALPWLGVVLAAREIARSRRAYLHELFGRHCMGWPEP